MAHPRLDDDRGSRGAMTVIGPVAPYKGGIAQHTTELVGRLRRSGRRVTVESWRHQYPSRLYPGASQLGDDPADQRDTNFDLSWRSPVSWWRVARRIRRRGDRVVLVGVTPYQFPIFVTMLVAGAGPAVLIAHNVVPHEPRRGDRALTRAAFRRVVGVMTHSRAEQALALEHGAHSAGTAALAPFHFADAVTGPPRSATRSEGRTGLLAFIGFVRPYKGLDLAIRALGHLDPHISLEVRGEFWDDPDTYLRLAEEIGVSHRCRLVPGYATTAEVVDLIDRSDALVLPYRTGTGSQFPKLAHARGVPVVATTVGDLPDQIHHGVDGLLVPAGDLEALTAALRHLYEPGVAEDLAANCRRPDADRAWNDYIAVLMALFDRTAADDRRFAARTGFEPVPPP